jgi:putative ABC transport system ATP-binding protein
MTAPVLSCRGVVHHYDGAPALRGVDLDIFEGEVVALTGPSGSGKSTLLLCLAGILVPTEGSVSLGGVDLRALGERGRAALRRESLGMVFQYGTLVPELTGEENVALPLLLAGRPRREALAAAGEWLQRIGIGTVGRTTAGRMSGGERQRVALARALVARPRVVLADEPTGALDSIASDLVVAELVGAAREAGAAVVLVTHDARVAAHADREVHLWDGRIDGAAALDPSSARATEGGKR